MKNPYKYGVILLTNDKNWFDNLGNVKDGIYVAIEAPKEIDQKIMNSNWIDHWLEKSKSLLRRKLYDAGKAGSSPTK